MLLYDTVVDQIKAFNLANFAFTENLVEVTNFPLK